MRLAFVGLLALTAAGCATPVGTLTPISDFADDVRYFEGIPSMRSVGESTRVFLSPTGTTVDPARRVVFRVHIENRSYAPINVGPENFLATTPDGKALKIYSAEKLENEARQRAVDAEWGAAFAAASNNIAASQAGRSTVSGSYSGQVSSYSGGYSSASYGGSYNATVYNAGAAASAQIQANAANRAIFADAQATKAEIMSNSQVGAFQRHTLSPGDAYTSTVTLDRMPDKAGGVVVRLKVGADTHVFTWKYSQEE